MIEAAEAKALYGLVTNRPLLEELVERLLAVESLSGKKVAAIAKKHKIRLFSSPSVEGFG